MKLFNFLKKEWLGILGCLIGIVGIAIAFLLPISTRDAVFLIESPRTRILESDRILETPLNIYTQDGKKIEDDVSAARIYFWNRGKIPIRSSDILKDLSISMQDTSVDILQFKLEKTCRDVINFNLKQFKDEKNKAKLSFDILEENDGASIQVIFKGPHDAPISLSGVIVGDPSIADISQDIGESWWVRGPVIVAIIIFFFVSAAIIHLACQLAAYNILTYYIPSLKEEKNERKTEILTFLFGVIILIAVVVLFSFTLTKHDASHMKLRKQISPPQCIKPF